MREYSSLFGVDKNKKLIINSSRTFRAGGHQHTRSQSAQVQAPQTNSAAITAFTVRVRGKTTTARCVGVGRSARLNYLLVSRARPRGILLSRERPESQPISHVMMQYYCAPHKFCISAKCFFSAANVSDENFNLNTKKRRAKKRIINQRHSSE